MPFTSKHFSGGKGSGRTSKFIQTVGRQGNFSEVITHIPQINRQPIDQFLQYRAKPRLNQKEVVEKRMLKAPEIQYNKQQQGQRRGEDAYKMPMRKVSQIPRNKSEMQRQHQQQYDENEDDDSEMMNDDTRSEMSIQDEYQSYEKPPRKQQRYR